MASTFTITVNEISPRLRAFPARMDSTLAAFCAYEAPQVQSYARENAPWTDRTGNARGGLFARSTPHGGHQGVELYHTMPYGIWLEVRHGGKYAIIKPTILREGQRMMRDLRRLLGMMPK